MPVDTAERLNLNYEIKKRSGCTVMEEEIIGAIKIKDGLFIGDEFAAKVTSSVPKSLLSCVQQDLEFIITNKVTHVINTAGQQLANFWETVGVGYLTFDWVESDTQVLILGHLEI